ncbi:MAG: acyltransferase [Duganella sp.]
MKSSIAGAPGANRPPSQFGLINLLKVVAAQLIVLHHLAFYGPMADYVRPIFPDLIGFLGDSARIAVQVFLVIGGFLAAKSLSPSGLPSHPHPLGAIWHRYTKLAPPFIAATLVAAMASAWAGHWMTHDSISEPATLSQLAAHAVLMHGVLDYPSLSAGAWYVAIDFQLYAALVMLLWLAGVLAGKRMVRWLMPLLVAVGITLSLLHFNLDAEWDVWAPYFFGSYGLGLMAWWASDPKRSASAITLIMLGALLPALAGLVLEFRSRIALAVVVACVLFVCGRVKTPSTGKAWTTINQLGKISYAVFLIHFPVCLLVNAAFTHFVPAEPELQALGMLVAWSASLLAGAVFHHWVEVPLSRAVQRVSDKVDLRGWLKPENGRPGVVTLR